jgi:hypothetical protein
MDERLRFVARLLEGEKMTPLCAEFGISRKTGYHLFNRYKDCGVAAFTDRSRRPYRQANRLPPQLEAVIVRLKREYPGWGGRRSAKSCGGSRPRRTCRPSAPCMRSWTVTSWSSGGAVVAPARPGPRGHGRPSPTRFGAPTTKASSCSATGATAIR